MAAGRANQRDNLDDLDPREYGWESIAEHLLDIAGLIPKPPDPTGSFDDGELRRMPIADVEDNLVAHLAPDGQYVMHLYREQLRLYREAVRSTIKCWRDQKKL